MPNLDIFAYTRGPHDAQIICVGEAWGEQESQTQLPFMGGSGKLLEELLTTAGINPQEVLFTNLLNARPAGNDISNYLLRSERKSRTFRGLRPNRVFLSHLAKLNRLIAYVRPRLIIACGNWPLWHLTTAAEPKTTKGYKLPTGIGKWAGSELHTHGEFCHLPADIPVLPIYHPAAILRQYPWRVITHADLLRAHKHPDAWSISPHILTHLHPTPKQLQSFCERHQGQTVICDLETSNRCIHIVGLLAPATREAVVVPFFDIGRTPCAYSPADFAAIFLTLQRFFAHPRCKLVGQNFLYDLQYIGQYFGAHPQVIHDTMVAQHITFPALRGFKGLDSLSRFYSTTHRYWKDERKEALASENLDLSLRYNLQDLVVTWEVWKAQTRNFQTNLDLHTRFTERMALLPILRDMTRRGTNFDHARRASQLHSVTTQLSQVRSWLAAVMPPSLVPADKTKTPWYDSPTQLITILFRTLKLKGGWDPTTRSFSSDKETLAKLARRYPHLQGLFSALIIYRSLRVLQKGFLSANLSPDARIRCSFNLAGPTSMRFASTEDAFRDGSNLQNILRDRVPMDLLEQDLV